MAMDRLDMDQKFSFDCHCCNLPLTNDEGGWFTGSNDLPTWRCPNSPHGEHQPIRKG